MSGPKVVRIVTREEIDAICRRHLAAVQSATEDFRGKARKLGLLDDALENSLQERSRQLSGLFEAGRWLDLQKHAPEAVAFLRAESGRLQERAVAAAADARGRSRRLLGAARSVAAALAAAGLEVPPALQASSRGLGPDRDAACALEREIAAAMRQLASVERKSTSANMKALAERLTDGEGIQTVTAWLAGRSDPPSPAEERLDRLLSEIAVLRDAAASPFEVRATEIGREQDPSRRSLLTDSLVLDVSAHVARLRAEEELRHRLGQALAALSQSTTQEARALRSRIEAAWKRPAAATTETLEAEAQALVSAEAQVLAAAARRRAILSGLAELGYEVGAEMETAWVREGRVVVRRPGTADYGVELGAPADASRLQVRLVGSDRPSAPRDARRDADQETIWCTDFDRLKASLSVSGSELMLERALEPGAQLVKTVRMPQAAAMETEVSARRPAARTTGP